jgi:hypothetical protein
MAKLSRTFGLTSLMVALTLAGPAAGEGADFTGKPAPDFAIEEMSVGTETSLSDFDGRVVLLDFWFIN